MSEMTPTEALAEAWAVVRGPYSDHRDISALLAALRTRGYTVAPIGAASDPTTAVAALRALSWTVVAPVDPNAAIPAPEAGQVWVSPKPRVAARTVVRVGANCHWPGDGNDCVYFTASGYPNTVNPRCLNSVAWASWVRESGARPQETGV